MVEFIRNLFGKTAPKTPADEARLRAIEAQKEASVKKHQDFLDVIWPQFEAQIKTEASKGKRSLLLVWYRGGDDYYVTFNYQPTAQSIKFIESLGYRVRQEQTIFYTECFVVYW